MRRAVLTFLILHQNGAQAFGCNYGINLANPSTYWGSVLSNHRLPFVANKGIVSQGPFLIDTNHRERALLIGPLVVWVEKVNGRSETSLGDIDLTNTRMKIRIKMEYSPENEADQGLEENSSSGFGRECPTKQSPAATFECGDS
jgi:hypothetical protein